MDTSSIRNFRDFLLQYNRISQSCFLSCVDHLHERELSQDETRCVDMCTRKHVKVNHKVMQVYMEIQPIIVNKRMEEMNKQAAMVEATKQQQQLELAKQQQELDSAKTSNSKEEVT